VFSTVAIFRCDVTYFWPNTVYCYWREIGRHESCSHESTHRFAITFVWRAQHRQTAARLINQSLPEHAAWHVRWCACHRVPYKFNENLELSEWDLNTRNSPVVLFANFLTSLNVAYIMFQMTVQTASTRLEMHSCIFENFRKFPRLACCFLATAPATGEATGSMWRAGVGFE